MTCNDPECDSCNPESYCEIHERYDRGYCEECLAEESEDKAND
jgi:hypothetical protein